MRPNGEDSGSLRHPGDRLAAAASGILDTVGGTFTACRVSYDGEQIWATTSAVGLPYCAEHDYAMGYKILDEGFRLTITRIIEASDAERRKSDARSASLEEADEQQGHDYCLGMLISNGQFLLLARD